MESLKPCPFCNQPGTLERTRDISHYWVPMCSNARCGCRLCAWPTRREAAQAWNERAATITTTTTTATTEN
ncbi:Lar family restriction alleviation protein [Cupriavidus oxalaticus]|uniref:Restriction alleviation protein, Lar family n=1 Tax=Cupriavidus oxalaticus TaxID=96344 RepID=A0A5P3VIT7_9BURK|nr:Lar family restriction alleviation protein [Cupriavidus oxalaticus]QEZ44719.1 hypothetical protein D2917_11055 [Cupriavidus oxalaticus]